LWEKRVKMRKCADKTKCSFRDKRVGVLLGGLSSEREISLKTGAAVLKALLSAGYEAIAIDAGLDLFTEIREQGVEVAFIALHGGTGENGSVQGGLEVMGIPYTGSGVLASALAMDKTAAKKIFLNSSIATPAFSLIPTMEGVKGLRFPLVVKPSAGGSTLGLSIIEDMDGLPAAVELARSFDQGVLIEEYITGREVSLSILDGRVYPVVEIFPKGGLYDFTAKYSEGGASFKVPAELSEALTGEVSSAALKSYVGLGCRGAARVDIIIDREDNPFVLEVNTSPGLTERSLLPMAAKEVGLSYRELVVRLLEGATLEEPKIEPGENEKQTC